MFLKKRKPNIGLFLSLFLTTYFFIIFGAFFSTSHAAIITPSEISNLVIHYDALDTDGDGNPANEPSNNNRIATWVDKANGFDANQPVSNQRPKYTTTKWINGLASISFDGNNDFANITSSGIINENATFTEKSFATVFRTWINILNFQVIYEQWWADKWYNIIVYNGHVYAWAWNTVDRDAGHKYKSVDLWVVQKNTVYFIVVVQDSTSWDDSENKLSIYLNGNLASFQTHVDPQTSHTWSIWLWSVREDTVNLDDNSTVLDGSPLYGSIWEMISWNHALTYSEIQWVQNYFLDKWLVTALTEIERVEIITTDTNPSYIFSSNATWSLTYAWSCDSTATSATIWDNTITFDSDGAGAPLTLWEYSDCVITLTDYLSNEITLNVSPFNVVENTTGTGIILPSAIASWVFHLNAQDTDGDANPANEPSNSWALATWVDLMNTNNATQTGGSQQWLYIINSINWWPSIQFDGIDDYYNMTSTGAIDSDPTFTQKSFWIVFKTWDDVNTFQTIYEQWWDLRWYNIIVDNWHVYAWAWNSIEWDIWEQYKSVDLWAVEPNSVYFSVIIQDSQTANDLLNRLYIYLNGSLASFQEHVDAQVTQTGSIWLWGIKEASVQSHDNIPIIWDGNYFGGKIWELISWNHALTYSEIQWIQNYFVNSWNITLFYETQAVTSPTTSNNPLYKFYSNAEGTLSYTWGCDSITTSAVVWENTITFDSDGAGSWMIADTYSNCKVTLDVLWTTSTINVTPFTIELAEFSLTEVTPIPSPDSDSTPDYTFNSPIAGTITYIGACSSATTTSTVWNNTVTLNSLADGTYNDCYLKVTNASQITSYLHIWTFTISTDFTGPTITSTSPTDNDLLPIGTFTFVLNYEDNVWGIWVDSSSITKTLHKWDGISAYWADISGTYLTTNLQWASSSNYSINSAPFWKYKLSFSVSDLAANNTAQEIIFYIDEIEATIGTWTIDIGTLPFNSTAFSSNELIVTVKTLWAWFNIVMNKTTLLQIGATAFEQIPDWDGAKGFWYDQEVYSGTPTAITTDTIIGSQAASLNTNGDKNTYTYKLKYWALFNEAEQFAWDYQTFVNFTISTSY